MLGIIIVLTVYVIIRLTIHSVLSKIEAKKVFEKYNNRRIKLKDIK